MDLFFSKRRGAFGGFLSPLSGMTRCWLVPASVLVAAAAACTGCQSARPIASHLLIEHQAVIDFSGLKPAEAQESLQCVGAVPRTWEQVGPVKKAFYNHTQWRSPSGHTAVGVAYIHLPLPLNADVLLYLAKLEYAKRSNDGRIASRWTDSMGRNWFEAENDKYHVQGYALAQGFEGWFVYFGYKMTEPPNMSEISLAARSVDSFVPKIDGAPEESAKAAPASKPTDPAGTTQPSKAPSPWRVLGLDHRPAPAPTERR